MSISQEHIRREAQKIVDANDGQLPEAIPRSAVQATVESAVDVDGMEQEEYDLLFERTHVRLKETLHD